jgi:hypothetical protein
MLSPLPLSLSAPVLWEPAPAERAAHRTACPDGCRTVVRIRPLASDLEHALMVHHHVVELRPTGALAGVMRRLAGVLRVL